MAASEIKLVALFLEKDGPIQGGILDVWNKMNPRVGKQSLSASGKCAASPIRLKGWTAGGRSKDLFQHIDRYLSAEAQGCHTVVQRIDIHYGRTIPAYLVTFFKLEPDISTKKVVTTAGVDLPPDFFVNPWKYAR